MRFNDFIVFIFFEIRIKVFRKRIKFSVMRDVFDYFYFYNRINFIFLWFIVVEKLMLEFFGDGDMYVFFFLSFLDI